MRLVLLFITISTSIPDFITVRNFSFVNENGESVLRLGFDRRRLKGSAVRQRLTLKFGALGKYFAYQLRKSPPIFAPGATIKITGRVR